jgi:signal transduction histidine kinase/CheY-like chemotaxis protein
MSSSDVTLQEFIAPIPICCQEANLATVIAAIGSSKSDSIAIVDRDRFPLGIVRCRRLTAFLLARKYITVASNATEIQLNKREFPTVGDLNHLIEPVVNLTAQMKIGEFLLYLQSEPATHITTQTYTVLDSRGKLLGLVDIPQILNCLSFQSQKSSISASSKISRESTPPSKSSRNALTCELLQILEQIPLPIALQTVTGKNLYQNYHWQNSIDAPHQLEAPTAKTITYKQSLAKPTETYIPATQITTTAQTQRQEVDSQWRFWRQSNFKNEARLLPELDSELHCYCLKGNYYVTSVLTSSQQPVIINELFDRSDSVASLAALQERDVAPNTKNLLERDRQTKSLNWSYLRLPLKLNSQQVEAILTVKQISTNQTSITGSDKYWLTIAIKPEMFSPPISSANPTSAEALGLERLKDELLANISHELKSPLTGIVGLSSLLQQQKLGDLNPRQLRYIRSIERSGRQLMNIVNNLLDWSNLAIGQFELNLEPIKLKELCSQIHQQVISKLQPNSKLSQQQLQLQTTSDLAIADRWQLSQIMTHLIQNAVQFSPPGYQIKIEIEPIKGWIAITVWDRGSGIPQSKQVALLERLSQSNRQEIATSLGLILARQLAKAHGGDISFISQVDRGSRFTLLLPDLTNSPSSKAIRTKEIVLIVETQPEIIGALSLKLKQQEAYSIVARTGIEALAKARQFKPKTIFLNPDLPLVSGQSILTLLKLDSQTQRIPIFIITKRDEKAKIKQKYPQAEGFICLSPEESILNSINTENPPPCEPRSSNLTILCLNLSDRDIPLKDWVRAIGSTQRHRAIEADNLEQANMLAKIWQIDAIVLNGRANAETSNYLKSIEEFPVLSALPLITLDPETTAIANQIQGLSVFPCLVPAQCRDIGDLLQVIQIATGNH